MNRRQSSRGDGNRPERGERIAFGFGLDGQLLRERATASPQPAAVEAHREDDSATVVAPARERFDLAYLGLLAFTAMLFLRPQDIFPPLGYLHLAEVSAVVALVALVNGRLARQEPVVPLTPEVRRIILFAGIMLALVPFSVWPGGSLAMLLELYLKVVLIFILMAGTLTTTARLRRLVWVILLASAYISFRGVFDYLHGVNLIEVDGRLAGSIGGVFQNPNDLALNMVAYLPAALLLAARRGRPTGRLIAALACVLMFATIVFTKSRGGFLGLGAMLIVLLAQGSKVRRGFGTGVVVAILVAVPLLPSSFWERMASITSDSEDVTGSREARKTVMKEAWAVFLERPLTGVGPGEFKDYNPAWRQERSREAHNAYLQVASESGIAGALVFLSLVWMAVRDAWSASRLLSRGRRQDKAATPPARAMKPSQLPEDQANELNLYATAMSASIVGWIVCAMFASVAYTWTFYYVFGISMAAHGIATTKAARARRPAARARGTMAA